MKQRRIIIVLFWLFVAFRIPAQEFAETDFTLYTTTEGLSSNTVTGIAQDSTGYIWVATNSGLNRYNGSRFVHYHSDNDSLSLSADELSGMSWLDNRRLAVFTAGVHIIDTRTGKTHNLFIPYKNKKYQYKFNMIVAAKSDEEGNIYVLSRSGFYHFDNKYKLVSRFDYYSEQSVLTEHFFFGRYLYELDSRRLLIIGIDGLYVYNKETRKIRKMEPTDAPLLSDYLAYPGPSYTNSQFYQTEPGSFFIMTLLSDTLVYVNLPKNQITYTVLPFNPLRYEFHYRSRLYKINDSLYYVTSHNSGFYEMRIDPKTGRVNFNPTKFLPSYMCSDLLIDKDNNLWLATNKGILKQDLGKSQVKSAIFPTNFEETVPNIRFDDIYVISNKVYAGTRSRLGLLQFDKKTFKLEGSVISPKDYETDNFVYALTSSGPNELFLGTGGPLLLYNIDRKKESRIVPPKWRIFGDWTFDLKKDSKGNIWISSYNVYRYNTSTKTFDVIPPFDKLLSVLFVIDEDRDGNIWMAGHGLARYNTKLNAYDMYIDSFPFIKMTDKQINALVVDNDNTVWFNSNNNGLIGYNIPKKSFRHITRNEGLPSDNIASMIVIGNKLWIATLSGIACMDLRTYKIVSFGKEDGFPQIPLVKGAKFFYDSLEQQLYLSFSTRIVRFNPFRILEKKKPPHIFVENVNIGQKNSFLPTGEVETSWNRNDITITIGSINFTDNYNQRFAYRILRGNNPSWQQLGNQPTFSISNLSPGSYTIQLKAFSMTNRWPEQLKELTLIVNPPFWQKTWFTILMFIVTMAFLYLIIKWRTELVRKKEMEKTHMEKLKADDYKNQFELEQISNYFSSSMSNKKTEDEVLWDVTNNLIGRLNFVDLMIYLWNEDKTKMVQKAAHGPKGQPELLEKQVFEVYPGQGIVGHVIETRQPLLVPDTRKDKRYRVDEEFRLSEVCVPILHNGELLGIVDSEHPQANYFSERDLNILTTIATLIGNKLKQIESEKSLHEQKIELVNINEQLAEARLSALQAQMNPHFVFNALNSIKRMILDGDNEKASRYLSKFAQMIRMTLEHSKEIFITLDENIEYLKAYLEMEQLRFDDSFVYKISTADNIDLSETPIPSMMIQPLVENAIWHGLMTAEAEKKIIIAFSQDDKKITCVVEDNGIGIRQSERLKKQTRPLHNSVGLENLQKRIMIMNEKYDMNCSLNITDLGEVGNNGSGTRVMLQFNLLNI